MAAAEESPGSTLSDIDSDEFDEDPKFEARSRDDTISVTDSHSASTPQLMPPLKRRRTGPSAYDHATPTTIGEDVRAPPSPSGSISSDTSGEVPNSPSFANLGPTHPLSTAYAAHQANPDDPDAADTAQVTRCLWEGCEQSEQGNMDNLVNHIHDEHIGLRQKRYSCEWENCNRKGMPHASGYALRAHMRSHTKEKPFYCALPECDRSFTRSDALAKHMRTVHETEALRPSDPIPKNHSEALAREAGKANGGLKRIKLILNNGEKPKPVISDPPPLPVGDVKNEEGEGEPIDVDDVPFQLPVPLDYYPPDVATQLDGHDLSMPPSQLCRLLRRQVHWAEQEGKQLDKDIEHAFAESDAENASSLMLLINESKGDKARRAGWKQTEQLLDAVLDKEIRDTLKKYGGDVQIADDADPWALVKGIEHLG